MKHPFQLFLLSLAIASCAMGSTQAAEEKKGGCMPGLASCCLGPVPGGQVMNSGYKIPGRAWIRLCILPIAYDAFKAYQGETAEEYIGVDSIDQPADGGKKGGIAPALVSCCLGPVGVPQGQIMNSTGSQSISFRPVLGMIPYVSFLAWAYDGYQAYQGETLQEYSEIK
jgi:hypothetical protein